MITAKTPGFDVFYAYTGRIWDEATGLYNFRTRIYDAHAGRFLSEDWIGFNGGQVNLVVYVGNSPTNFVDPSGLQEEWVAMPSRAVLLANEYGGTGGSLYPYGHPDTLIWGPIDDPFPGTPTPVLNPPSHFFPMTLPQWRKWCWEHNDTPSIRRMTPEELADYKRDLEFERQLKKYRNPEVRRLMRLRYNGKIGMYLVGPGGGVWKAIDLGGAPSVKPIRPVTRPNP